MATYEVYLIRAMSRVVTVEADSEEEAREAALEENDLDPNISNNFEVDGDIEIHYVRGV